MTAVTAPWYWSWSGRSRREEVLADGGQVATTEDDDATHERGCDEEWCPGPDADELPCFECFRDK